MSLNLQDAVVEEGNDLFSVSVVGKMRPNGAELLQQRFRLGVRRNLQ